MELAWRPTTATLAPRLARAVRDAPLGGRTGVLDDTAPPGGQVRLEVVAELGADDRAFDRVGDALLSWRLHRAARMVVATDRASVSAGATIVDAAPFGPVAVVVPCRIVEVVDEPRRRGFVYSALPGHPLVGEEQFTVERGADDRVLFRIRSHSRPVGAPALAPPAARAAQRFVNRRYLAAARSLAA
jgi:uncharacterized protein (UPF0548 family)